MELEAEAGAERAIEGHVPVKRETWLFFAGKLMRYRGQLHYNSEPPLPGTEWRMDWSNGERLEASAANVLSRSLSKQVPDCRWDGCRKNLAEARAQLAASDAQLQSEGERYLQLAQDIADAVISYAGGRVAGHRWRDNLCSITLNTDRATSSSTCSDG
ncbi:hypothetical protein C4K23_3483 [Pseudomonas chlororaphis]|nr:hypothetical protein C4K23_3483 [Pseudomonas chlororaphis]